MPRPFTQSELEAYLDEALPAAEMARIEAELRRRPELAQTLVEINSRRDAGRHSLGDIWRRRRISCPSREQLGSMLLGTLADDEAAYVRFHIERVGCRYCQANLDDLAAQQEEAAEAVLSRRRRYFQSSAGYLRRGD